MSYRYIVRVIAVSGFYKPDQRLFSEIWRIDTKNYRTTVLNPVGNSDKVDWDTELTSSDFSADEIVEGEITFFLSKLNQNSLINTVSCYEISHVEAITYLL